MMFQVDSFIKWNDKDESGSYEYVGQVKMMHGDTVIFEDAEGVMYGVHKNDGTFTSINKPKNWNRPKSVMLKPIESEKPKKSIKKTDGGPTKLDQVVALLQANKNLITNRKAAIDSIVTHVGMTPAGASTYFAKAKKMVDQGA
jgi:hypothetical protein